MLVEVDRGAEFTLMKPADARDIGTDLWGERALRLKTFRFSACSRSGSVFGLRESRSAAVQGPAVPTESNELTDGTLIDLCGATLLWRSTEGMKKNNTK